jgi:pilus assembly protein Flp/PilA
MTLLKSLRKFAVSENGATMVEYGLIVGLLSLVCVIAVETSGDALLELFTRVSDKLQEAVARSA